MSDRDNTIAIWKNDRREKDTHPHYTGQATFHGTEYWVSVWKRDDNATGNPPLLKVSFQAKEDRPSPRPAAQDEVTVDIDQDLPF